MKLMFNFESQTAANSASYAASWSINNSDSSDEIFEGQSATTWVSTGDEKQEMKGAHSY
jgi:hypothetical protein